MTAKILDGKVVNEKIAKELSNQVKKLNPKPKLVIIQVGDLSESNAYIGRKKAFGEKIGAIVDHKKFPEDVTQKTLISQLSSLNSDTSVTGIIIQMPLPKHLDKDEIIDTIAPAKDVDGLTSQNIKKLWGSKNDAIIPATTKGILTILDYYKIPVTRQKVVIVGRSTLVGKPTLLALLNRDATVTVCHKATKKLREQTKSADILIVAAGKPKLINKDYVSQGQVVIDVGINAVENEDGPRKLVGDVDFDSVKNIVAAISPVPGGIGPMTVASLFENLLDAYKHQT